MLIHTVRRPVPGGTLRVLLPEPPYLAEVLAFLGCLQAQAVEAELLGDQLMVRVRPPLGLVPPEHFILQRCAWTDGALEVAGTLYCPGGALVCVQIHAGIANSAPEDSVPKQVNSDAGRAPSPRRSAPGCRGDG